MPRERVFYEDVNDPSTLKQLLRLYEFDETFHKMAFNSRYERLAVLLLGERANHVWCTDITYIPVQGGFLYLVAVMDWATRRVLAWRLSNTMDTEFCLEGLTEALGRYGTPEIFNTDQGSQFTSIAFTAALQDAGIRCSMDGRGRCLDNAFIERLWRSLKYEAVYLRELADGFAAQRVIDDWMEYYNEVRPHSSLAGRTPAEAYRDRGSKLEKEVA